MEQIYPASILKTCHLISYKKKPRRLFWDTHQTRNYLLWAAVKFFLNLRVEFKRSSLSRLQKGSLNILA